MLLQRAFILASVSLSLACASVGPIEEPDGVLIGGKADLPNDGLWEREHDGRSYRSIAQHFASAGFDVAVDESAIHGRWPVDGGSAALDRFGTPLFLGNAPYFHTALDILREDPTASAEVRAPFSGRARLYDWNGTPGASSNPYATIVAIWDPESRVIAQLMHVDASERLRDATDFIDVEEGEVVGTLAYIGGSFSNADYEAFRHTHLSLIDGGSLRSLDPGALLPYEDDTPPELLTLYVLDEEARRHDALRSGQLDVVIEVADRDAHSDRNFEVDRIAFEIHDDQGTLLRSSAECAFDHLYEDASRNYRLSALNLIDFGNARGQIDGSWPGSDIGNRERTFRYALTQFEVRDERCTVLTDAEGFVAIDDTVQWIEVSGTLVDVRGNTTEFRERLARDGSPTPEPPVDPEEPATPEPWGGSMDSGQVGSEGVRFEHALGTGRFGFEMTGVGDADLYVRVGEPPTLDAYDCRPYRGDADEQCAVVLDEPSRVHVWVRAFRDTATFELIGRPL